MEDAHTDITDISSAVKEIPDFEFPAQEGRELPSQYSFYAVYDGHAGPIAAEIAARDLWQRIVADPDVCFSDDEAAISQAVVRHFEEFDRGLIERARAEAFLDGAAATACLVRGSLLLCANAGDSRAVLCRGGIAKPLSVDHKPSRPSERERVIAAGGRVHPTKMRISEAAELDLGPERVWPGGLALSRGLGDLSFKNLDELRARYNVQKELVTATPEVRHTHIQPGLDEFIIVACDGLWDVMTSQTACDFVRARRAAAAAALPPTLSAEEADREVADTLAQALVQEAFYRNSQDNISVVVVLIRDATTPTRPDEWARLEEAGRSMAAAAAGDEPDFEEDDFFLHATAAVAIPHAGAEPEAHLSVLAAAFRERPEWDVFDDCVRDVYPEEKVPVTVHNNPLDPSNPANFPTDPPNPPPIEDDYDGWGIICISQGGFFM